MELVKGPAAAAMVKCKSGRHAIISLIMQIKDTHVRARAWKQGLGGSEGEGVDGGKDEEGKERADGGGVTTDYALARTRVTRLRRTKTAVQVSNGAATGSKSTWIRTTWTVPNLRSDSRY